MPAPGTGPGGTARADTRFETKAIAAGRDRRAGLLAHQRGVRSAPELDAYAGAAVVEARPIGRHVGGTVGQQALKPLRHLVGRRAGRVAFHPNERIPQRKHERAHSRRYQHRATQSPSNT